MNDLIKRKLDILPDQPGCYLMKDRQGTTIYVGKAKVLKKIEYAPILLVHMRGKHRDL